MFPENAEIRKNQEDENSQMKGVQGRHQLNGYNWFQVFSYLSTNRKRLEGVYTVPEITKELQKELALKTLTERSVRTALYKIGMKVKNSPNKEVPVSLITEIAELTKKVVELERRIANLEDGLGVKAKSELPSLSIHNSLK